MIPVPALVRKENRRAVIGVDQEIKIAVMIEVGIGSAARHHRALRNPDPHHQLHVRTSRRPDCETAAAAHGTALSAEHG